MQTLSPISLNAVELYQVKACIDALGTDTFPREISRLALLVCDAEAILLCGFFDDASPVALYCNHIDAVYDRIVRPYLEKAYILDPFYERFLEKRGDEVLQLRECAPDDFEESEYCQRFYLDCDLQDEIMMILHVSETSALSFSLGNAIERDQVDTTKLKSLLPVLASMCRRHWIKLSPEDPDGQGRIASHLQLGFKLFGTSVLSPKEGEIVRLILKGHSSKSIARMFDNSPDTIKVHRRRIFNKLKINSQGEMMSIFLEALGKYPPGSTEDPLLFLERTS